MLSWALGCVDLDERRQKSLRTRLYERRGWVYYVLPDDKWTCNYVVS